MAKVITIDFTDVRTDGGFIRVPEGDYALELKSVSEEVGEDSGKPYLKCSFEITDGHKRGVGKTIWDNFSLQKQALWKFRGFLESCGKSVSSSKIKIPLEKLKGLKVAATLVDDEYEGKKKSIVASYFPLEDLGNTSDGTNDEEFGDDEEQEKPVEKKKTRKKPQKEEESEEEEGGEEEELFS